MVFFVAMFNLTIHTCIFFSLSPSSFESQTSNCTSLFVALYMKMHEQMEKFKAKAERIQKRSKR